MNLADANKMLQGAGYTSTIVQNDTMVGVIIESYFASAIRTARAGHRSPAGSQARLLTERVYKMDSARV
jgi:hypothetical protein